MVGGYADGEEIAGRAGATPDEALAALVAAVEGEATARRGDPRGAGGSAVSAVRCIDCGRAVHPEVGGRVEAASTGPWTSRAARCQYDRVFGCITEARRRVAGAAALRRGLRLRAAEWSS